MEEENRFEEAEKKYKQKRNYTEIVLGFLALIASVYYAYTSFYEPTYSSKKLPKTKIVPKIVAQVKNVSTQQQNVSSQHSKQEQTKEELECPAPLPEIPISLNNSFEKKIILANFSEEKFGKSVKKTKPKQYKPNWSLK